MRYFDIHVTYGDKDGDGYSIPVAINGNEEDAIKKAKEDNMFEYEEDIENIDYIDEMSEEDFKEIYSV